MLDCSATSCQQDRESLHKQHRKTVFWLQDKMFQPKLWLQMCISPFLLLLFRSPSFFCLLCDGVAEHDLSGGKSHSRNLKWTKLEYPDVVAAKLLRLWCITVLTYSIIRIMHNFAATHHCMLSPIIRIMQNSEDLVEGEFSKKN